jgi:hypothetical protein
MGSVCSSYGIDSSDSLCNQVYAEHLTSNPLYCRLRFTLDPGPGPGEGAAAGREAACAQRQSGHGCCVALVTLLKLLEAVADADRYCALHWTQNQKAYLAHGQNLSR